MVGCRNYVGNTFAHLAGGLGIAAAFSRIPAAEAFLKATGDTLGARIGIMIFYLVATIGLMIALRAVPVGGAAQYGLALGLLFVFSQTFKPVLDRLDQKDQLAHVFTLTAGVFFGMAALAYFGPVNFTGFGGFLFAGLLGLILGEILWLILEVTDAVPDRVSATGNKVFSWLGVGIFTLYAAYDTQMIKGRAAACRDRGDYINESLSLFLDFVNLFSNIARLQE